MDKPVWVFLAEARQKLLGGWSIVGSLLLLILIIQTATGKLEGVETTAWCWFIGLIFPCFILLIISVWQNLRPNKILPMGVYRTLMALALGYLGLVFVSYFLFQAAIEMNDFGIDVYLVKILKFLLPINLLLIIGLWLVLFKKESLFQPTSQAILQLAQQKAADAKDNKQTLKLECLEHIATGENTFAIDKMKMYFQKHHDSDLNVLIVLQSQLSKLKMDTELQVVESEEAQIAYNKSILGLVNLADSLSN